MKSKIYKLAVTTQGPTYPPSEIMNKEGDFVVIGLLNLQNQEGKLTQKWDAAIVGKDSEVPEFGKNLPYKIKKMLNVDNLPAEQDEVLYTLPTPLPCNNYPGTFAPEQKPEANKIMQPSYPLHEAPVPDMEERDGLKITKPILLSNWVKANGVLRIDIAEDKKSAMFIFNFDGLIPNALYTVMALRERDLNPENRSRPGPLGIPNVFITDESGSGHYWAKMPNPFPTDNSPDRNRIINVVLLFMSRHMSYGGAIGHHGLGGDIHAQLKLQESSFWEFETIK